jgi:hypothetical protein
MTEKLMSGRRDVLSKRIGEARRRLGPLTRAQNDQPYSLNNAELARCLAEVLSLLDEILIHI